MEIYPEIVVSIRMFTVTKIICIYGKTKSGQFQLGI